MEVHETVDVKASFEHDLLPILTARCALSGCHVADGPHGLDFRTYESFVAGGEHPTFVPGNAAESGVVEQIASGAMPPAGPPLSAAEIQLFVDWINQQEAQDGVIKHELSDEHAVETDIHEDMDDDHDEDMDGDDHGDDAHDDDEGEHGDMDDDDHDDDDDDDN